MNDAKIAAGKKAAELIQNERAHLGYSCAAVQEAATGGADGCVAHQHRLTREYESTFSPRINDSGCAWGEQWPDRKECRILALCFAAAMAEAGDL